MLEIFIGFIILITPYLLGCIINIWAAGFDFKYWEGIGFTYAAGIFILAILLLIGLASYYVGHFAMLVVK